MRTQVVVTCSLALAGCSHFADVKVPSRDRAPMVVTTSVAASGLTSLSVEPLEFAVCQLIYNLPRDGELDDDVLIVTGVDGTRWEYNGLIVDYVGQVPEIRIEEGENYRATFNLLQFYHAPEGASGEVGKVDLRYPPTRCS